MIDREKVIKGLKEIRDCESIVYEYSISIEAIEALEDAIALLKAQEPRVMTLDEVHVADICWMEVPGDDRVWPCEAIARNLLMSGNTTEIQFVGDGETHFRLDADYDRTWRCWTSRPTEAQREATTWQK